jgi:hypothetical protein
VELPNERLRFLVYEMGIKSGLALRLKYAAPGMSLALNGLFNSLTVITSITVDHGLTLTLARKFFHYVTAKCTCGTNLNNADERKCTLNISKFFNPTPPPG